PPPLEFFTPYSLATVNRVSRGRHRRSAPMALALAFMLVSCAHDPAPQPSAAPSAPPAVSAPVTLVDDETPGGGAAQPRVPSDPAQLADGLVADEAALRDPSTPGPALQAAARRQQAAYRIIGYHSEWDSITRPRIPAALLQTYDRNVDARRQLTAMAEVKDAIP